MCLIIIGRLDEEKILRSADSGNPHGIGLAWQTTEGVEYRKDLTVNDLLALPDEIKRYCVVHFRLATAGGRDKDLIHPFPVEKEVSLCKNGTADRLLMHNGHISGWEGMAKNIAGTPSGPMSDSRFMAFLVWKYGSDILYLFSGQRFVTMSKRKILMYGDWQKEDDRYYSNGSYKFDRTTTTYTGSYHKPVTEMTTEEWDEYCNERYGDRIKKSYPKYIGPVNRDSDGEAYAKDTFKSNRGKYMQDKDGIYKFVKAEDIINKMADELIDAEKERSKNIEISDEEIMEMWGEGAL